MGHLRGLRMKHISKRKLAGLALEAPLVPPDQEKGLRESMEEALKQQGQIYAFYHQGKMTGLFVFSREMAEQETLYIDAEELLQKRQEEKKTEPEPQFVYRLKVSCVLPGYEGCAAEMKESVLTELKEMAEWNDCKAILWGDEVIYKKNVRIGKAFVAAPLLGLCIGFLFGIALDNLALGICFGVCFATSLGGGWLATKGVTEKTAQKENKEE